MSESLLGPTPRTDKARGGEPGLALSIFRAALRRVSGDWIGPSVAIHTPRGEVLRLGNGAGYELSIRIRSFSCIRRVVAAGDIGFAEGYMAGEWDTPDLARLLTVLADNFDGLKRLSVGGPAAQLANVVGSLFRRNTIAGSRRNIYAHYDLGNAFYEAWLDPGMTYSSALYGGQDQDLEAAQTAKYARLAEAIGLQPGHEVLEIGCGWGGFATFAARAYGARVVGLTISAAQHAYAVERIRREGLEHLVEIRLADYRTVGGAFDRVVSIEMFEAVGEQYWPAYFNQVRARLKPGGRAGLQIITVRDDLFAHYRKRIDFIQKHIFPGGLLPGESRLGEEIARAGLTWDSTRRFGQDYARTLNVWSHRFDAAWPRLRLQGFDERFRRRWAFYLAYCEAGFATGRTDVIQAVLARPGDAAD
ncbi:MAG: SAM-dependent methyltransferase [Caulobacterales bacterium 32-69-10]|nr:MAG: SAM-dependent methyltransferase [Caulobacterales bacterium 32-69-10]